ncbi:hypothetical protein UFOVP78_36 [uncultured Caudovirales phage]|uniref:Uncharacterized protein n=1 Tax=uncultured Caudovirales phage TaxID=2100421 RepID=A0A6J5KWY5_9CAUD|nr:hypothetical protein UFOVP78_36 [uncultured Caudovirales phage]
MSINTIDLPPLAEAMTPAAIKAHLADMARRLGPDGYVSFSVGNVYETPYLMMYPDGIGRSGTPKSINDFDLICLLRAGHDYATSYGAIGRDKAIRKLALDVIDLTDQHGICTRAMLRGRGHGETALAHYLDAACERAGEMAAGAPFVVEG